MVYRRVSFVCALLTGLLGLLTLVGWFTGWEALASIRRDYIPMAPSTALAFSILGTVTVFRQHVPRPLALLLYLLVGIVAGGKLFEYFSGRSLGVEELLVADPAMFGAVRKGRMSPITALSFLLICPAIFGLSSARFRPWSGRISVAVLGISFIVLLGYLHGTPLLYGGTIIPVALPTAVAFCLLGVSVIADLGPNHWPLKPMTGDSARAVLLRWFLPAVVVIAVADGFVRTRFVTEGQLNPALSSALSTFFYTLVITWVISQVAKLVGGRIDRAELERNAAQEELRALNLDLERRITERTLELTTKNQQMEEELTMARELQLALLPDRFPSVPPSVAQPESALRFFSLYYPAGVVSGDFFSVFPVSDSAVGIFVCDVMGHGVRAALVTSMMRALLEQHNISEPDPGELLTQINQRLTSILRNAGTTLYATAVMIIADASRREVLYASAAHPKPLHICRQNSRVSPMDSAKTGALGIFRDQKFATARMAIAPGDAILVFTDGLFEVESPAGNLYSQEDLLVAVRRRTGLPAQQMIDQVVAEVQEFAGCKQFEDDVCVIGIEFARSIYSGDPTERSEEAEANQGEEVSI